jgi:hypothetical protein
MRLIALAIVALLALIALSASEHQAANAGLPLVNADYQRCFTVNPGPLRPPRRLSGDNRIKEIV